MPAASLDAVLRAGLRLQAEAPERFEAEATGAKLCELRKAPGRFKKSKTPQQPKAFQFPAMIPYMGYKNQRKGIYYTLKLQQLQPPKQIESTTYPLQYVPEPGAAFLTNFGMLSFQTRGDKPAMRVTKILVFRDENASPPETLFKVGYKIAHKVPDEQDNPVLTNDEYFDIPAITFSNDMCKDEKTIVDGLTTFGWVPERWQAEAKLGNNEGRAMQAAMTDFKTQVAHMVMQMAQAIKKIN